VNIYEYLFIKKPLGAIRRKQTRGELSTERCPKRGAPSPSPGVPGHGCRLPPKPTTAPRSLVAARRSPDPHQLPRPGSHHGPAPWRGCWGSRGSPLPPESPHARVGPASCGRHALRCWASLCRAPRVSARSAGHQNPLDASVLLRRREQENQESSSAGKREVSPKRPAQEPASGNGRRCPQTAADRGSLQPGHASRRDALGKPRTENRQWRMKPWYRCRRSQPCESPWQGHPNGPLANEGPCSLQRSHHEPCPERSCV